MLRFATLVTIPALFTIAAATMPRTPTFAERWAPVEALPAMLDFGLYDLQLPKSDKLPPHEAWRRPCLHYYNCSEA